MAFGWGACLRVMAITALAGCATDPSADAPFHSLRMDEACPPENDATGFDEFWTCGSVIGVRAATGSSQHEGTIRSAIDDWNVALRSTGFDLPTFFYDTEGNEEVTVTVNGGGPYCGFAGFSFVTLNTSCGPGAHKGTLHTALMHEFGNVIGFTDNLESVDVPGVSSPCVIFLPEGDGIDTNVCQHALEVMLFAFGHRASIPSDFYNRHIVTGIAFNTSSLTLNVGNEGSVSATNLLFANSANISSAELQGTNLTWSLDPVSTADFSLLGPGRVRAEDEGSAFLVAQVSSGLPSQFQEGTAILNRRARVSLTAQFAAPNGGFRVADIAMVGSPPPGPPIHAQGWHQFTASVVNAPASPVMIEWTVRFSSDPARNFTTSWQTTPLNVNVEEGSYNIEVTARARAGTGPYHFTTTLENFPVCTQEGGGGGGPYPYRAPIGEEPIPNAVEGC